MTVPATPAIGSTTAAPVVRNILEGLFGLPKTPFSLGNVQD